MINEQATFEKFGYYSTDLSPSSSKLVVAICENCKEDREISKVSGLKSKVCIKCQRVLQCKIISKVNRVGRKMSEEAKKRMRGRKGGEVMK